MTFVYRVADESGTERLGASLANRLPAGTVISLIGTLGAGKTRLVQAVARSLNIPDGEVSSPTFILIKEYVAGRRPVYHFDTYRLHDEDEFLELGPDEYFDADGLSFVEWGDRVETVLPEDRLEIRIMIEGSDRRRFEIRSRGDFPESVIEEIGRDLNDPD